MANFDSLHNLQELTKSLTDQKTRENVEKSVILKLISTLQTENTPNEIQLECLRALRNAVANVPNNGNVVINSITSDNNLDNFVERYIADGCEVTFLRVLTQVLANAVNQDIDIKDCVIENILDNAKLIFATSSDAKTKSFLSFCLLNLMKKQSKPWSMFLDFIPFWASDGDDFCLLCLKHVALTYPLVEVEPVARYQLHTVIRDLQLHALLEKESILSLAKDFTMLTDFVFKTQHSLTDDLKAQETLTLLDIIISVSQTDHKIILQDIKSLLINTLYLIRMMHEAGKTEEGNKDHFSNKFKPIGKLAELAELRKENGVSGEDLIENNPVFGFKVKLIQLLVNLVWEHPDNQNLVAEHTGLQLLLDCSQVDARNPFITQWVVMSVKALCQGNQNNQAILASLRRQGVADSALWAELGINLNPHEDKIKVGNSDIKPSTS